MTKPSKKRDTPRPPVHLKPATKRWFKSVAETFSLESHHVLLLQAAAEAWDELQAVRELVKTIGLVTVTKDTKTVHANPAVKIGDQAAIRFARLLRELNLDADPGTPIDARPPRIGGRKW